MPKRIGRVIPNDAGGGERRAEERPNFVKRPLSGIEKLIWTMSRRMPLNFVVAARVQTPFATDDLRAAAKALRNRYLGLAARIERENGALHWRTDDDVPDLPVNERIADDEATWLREIERQLAEPFDAWTGPLARFIVVRNADHVDLLAVCDHTVADGLSAVNLLRDVLVQMAAPEKATELQPLPESVFRLLPQSLLASGDVGRARRWGVRMIKAMHLATEVKRRLLRRPPPNIDLFPDRPSSDELRATINAMAIHVDAWSLDPERTQRLVNGCRREATTVHAALCVAFARAYARHDPARGRRLRVIESPVNVRRRLEPPVAHGAGLYNLLAGLKCRGRTSDEFWRSAREFKSRLDGLLNDVKLLTPVIVIEDLFADNDDVKLRRAAASFDREKFRHDMSISNLGRVNLPPVIGPYRVESVTGPFVIGRMSPVVGVATVNERISFSLTAHGRAPYNAILRDVIDSAMAALDEATRGPTNGHAD